MGFPETVAKRRGRLGASESEKALDLAQLIGQAQRIVQESGDPQGFDAAVWLARWLGVPKPALGGVPGEYLDTAGGRALVSQVVARMQSGAYS